MDASQLQAGEESASSCPNGYGLTWSSGYPVKFVQSASSHWLQFHKVRSGPDSEFSLDQEG